VIGRKVSTGNFDFLDLDSTEVARQLTLLDFAMFKAIKPQECMGQPWNKPESKEKASNIKLMIGRFNQVNFREKSSRNETSLTLCSAQ
jgi:hypothetical protein